MKTFTSVLLCSLLVGCATVDSVMSTRGVISESVSKMDGTRVVRMTPAIASYGPYYKEESVEFGLYWSSKMGDRALMTIQVEGAENFDRTKPINIKIDSVLFDLSPANPSDFGDTETQNLDMPEYAHNITQKDYVVNKDLILKIANAKETIYRIWFLGNKYSECTVPYMHQDLQSYVPKPFREFHDQVWGE